jgi:SRSO17 transposase
MNGRTKEEVQAWADEMEEIGKLLGQHFARAEPRGRVMSYMRGLMSEVERKNGWQLAEWAGDAAPYGMQHLLGRAAWDADAVRDDLRRYVITHLADTASVMVIDETGFLKKGDKSVGVQRQYSGTAGRIENCQVGVFLAYATPRGRAFLDRELYLPRSWTDDATRCKAAGVPAEVTFATKPQLAARMLKRVWEAGVKAQWVTADEVYGSDSAFRHTLEDQGQAFVVVVPSTQRLWIDSEQRAVRKMAKEVSPDAWQRLSAGEGAKGPRLYDWTRWPFNGPDPAFQHWVLVRRSVADPTELAYYFCAGPLGTSLEELVHVAGARWAVEDGFEATKGEVGLDQYEVRSWRGWYRHITLALFAHAFLAVVRTQAQTQVALTEPANAELDTLVKKRPPRRRRIHSFR